MYEDLRFAKNQSYHQFAFAKEIPQIAEIKGALVATQQANKFKIDGFYFDTYMISQAEVAPPKGNINNSI